MAIIANPKKHFNFSVFTPGLQPMLVQKLSLPDMGFDTDEHGDLNFKVKTAGLINVGVLKIEKISPIIVGDNWIWDWLRLIQDPILGGGALPSLYKRQLIIQQLAPGGVAVLDSWTALEAYPSKINGVDFSRVDSGNTMHSVEFQVDRIIKSV